MPLTLHRPAHTGPPPRRRFPLGPVILAATVAVVLATGGLLLAWSPQSADPTTGTATPTASPSAGATSAGATSAGATSASSAPASTPSTAAAADHVVMQNSASGLPFMLGAGGDGVATGAYATALGRPLDLVTTWADDNAAQTTLSELQPGGDLAHWKGSLDIALGAFDAGGTWAGAARGDDDARWSRSLRLLAASRAGATGTTYIRFAHEMNGNWYPWSVSAPQTADFITAWKRFRALQLQIFPTAKLVFCANQNSVGYAGNWTALYPGAGQVDLMSVDRYNNYPHITSDTEFDEHLRDTDQYGGPAGLDAHLAFAGSVGLPMAISEWSGANTSGTDDGAAFVRGMWSYLNTHAGTGPGQIPYAAQFNVAAGHQGQFNLLIGSSMPESSATYRSLFGRNAGQ